MYAIRVDCVLCLHCFPKSHVWHARHKCVQCLFVACWRFCKTSTDQSGLGNMDGLPGAVRHLQQYLIRHLSQARYSAHKSDAMSRHYWNCVNGDVNSQNANVLEKVCTCISCPFKK